MASRNKKGKIHGIFKSSFNISFFHKPSMEGTDIYYYVVLDNVIFLKMRLLHDVVLVIDEVTPLTMSYLADEYRTLFDLLQVQTSVSVFVSLIGNTRAFVPICEEHGAVIVEKEEFLDCSPVFYNKFKNYCQNDNSRYGFYLISLQEDSFKNIGKQKPEVVLQPPAQNDISDISPISTTQPGTEQEEASIPDWLTAFLSQWKNGMGEKFTVSMVNNKVETYKISGASGTWLVSFNAFINTIDVNMIECNMYTHEKITVIDTLESCAKQLHINIRINNVNKHDVMYNMLSDSNNWKLVGAGSFLY